MGTIWLIFDNNYRMGDCMSADDRHNHETKYRVTHESRTNGVNKDRRHNFIDQSRLYVPATENGKNLFKTFSDWD